MRGLLVWSIARPLPQDSSYGILPKNGRVGTVTTFIACRPRLRGPEIVVEVFARGLLEREHLTSLRIDARHDVLDGAVLARRGIFTFPLPQGRPLGARRLTGGGRAAPPPRRERTPGHPGKARARPKAGSP